MNQPPRPTKLRHRITLVAALVIGLTSGTAVLAAILLAPATQPAPVAAHLPAIAAALIVVIAGVLCFRTAVGRQLRPLGETIAAVHELEAGGLDARLPAANPVEELADLSVALNRVLDRLAEGFRTQERFLADVSHELKTPLSVLLGEAQVLSQQVRTAEEYERYTASVQDEVRVLAQLVDSMLVLARAEAGIAVLAHQDISINEAVTDAVQRCEPLARQREVRLVPSLALPDIDDPLPMVRGDGELVRVMLANLLRNAVRYSPAEEAVEVEVILQPDCIRVRVLDRGPGLPEGGADRIFQRFYTVAPPAHTLKGVGLGLPIARAIARLHGGDIKAANRPDPPGASFEVLLPHADRRSA